MYKMKIKDPDCKVKKKKKRKKYNVTKISRTLLRHMTMKCFILVTRRTF